MSINKSCILLGYSKQSYFKSRNLEIIRVEKESATTELIIRKVDDLRELMPKIGGLKLFDMISPHS
jgi:hypothetical protein